MQSFPYLQDLTNRSTMFTMEIALLIERCKQKDSIALGIDFFRQYDYVTLNFKEMFMMIE